MAVEIRHDAFGRYSLVREVVHADHADHRTGPTCAWCGNNTHDRLFRYGIEHDDRPGRVDWQRELFCGVECMRIYRH